jgi:hypothetical protein
MELPAGPLRFRSERAPEPLSEEQEAALAFAGCGITGVALADLAYGPGEGGGMIAGRVGRTIASPDAVCTTSLVIANDRATYLLKRPRDFAPAEIAELIALARRGELVELYRRSRVQIAEGRAAPPLDPRHNFTINRWALYAPGTTYFLPVIETTALTINALLEALGESMGFFLRDERASMRAAGLARFGRSRGGHLFDDPREGRTATLHVLESALMESCATEHGMMLQNLSLMAEALGLGGYPNFARHEYAWFQALGFRMGEMPATRYAGAHPVISRAARWLRRDPPVFYPLGLERDGRALLQPFCPPHFPDMRAAVLAYVEMKFGPGGLYDPAAESAWRDPRAVAEANGRPSPAAIEATIACCEYIHARYGRFPAYAAPFKTIIGFQACRLDPEFYQRHYQPGALPSEE